MSAENHYIVCSIAGSDPMGGAGVQGDLKTFAAHGIEGTAVVTAVTVQGPSGVEAVEPVAAEVVGAQAAVVLRHLAPRAVKTGMLWSGAIAAAVAGALDEAEASPLLVVDPVLAASAGGTLGEDDLVPALRRELLPRATVVTPNAAEAAALLGVERLDAADLEGAARALLELGAKAVIVKGGDAGADPVVDLVATAQGVERLALPRVPGPSPHGTGCAFAAALAVRLASGQPIVEAAARAKRYVHAAIRAGGGTGRLVHAVSPAG